MVKEKECGIGKVELIRGLNSFFSQRALFAKNVDLKLQLESQGPMEFSWMRSSNKVYVRDAKEDVVQASAIRTEQK